MQALAWSPSLNFTKSLASVLKGIVLVSSGGRNRISQSVGSNSRSYFSQSGAWKPKIQVPAPSGSGESSCPGCDGAFSPPSHGGTVTPLSAVSSYKDPNPVVGAPPS